jgi:hypothetical protein
MPVRRELVVEVGEEADPGAVPPATTSYSWSPIIGIVRAFARPHVRS